MDNYETKKEFSILPTHLWLIKIWFLHKNLCYTIRYSTKLKTLEETS